VKIALLHYAGPPTVGGVELTLLHHARLMTAAGYQVSILCGSGTRFDDRIAVHIIPELGSRHSEVLRVKKQLDAGQVTANFKRLRDHIGQLLQPLLVDVDVLIAHNVFTLHKNLALTAALHDLISPSADSSTSLHSAQNARVGRVIAWHHDFAWTNPLYRDQLQAGYPWNLLREAWPSVRHVTVSQARRIELARLYGIDPQSIEVIPPGVDPADFFRWTELTRELVARLNLLSADLILLLPARITRRKNIELAIRVLAELRRQTSLDARLIVTGPPGPHNPANSAYLQRLLSLRSELQLERAAHFLYECGEGDRLLIPDETLADLYTLSDALLFPSEQEGFGIPVLEAGLARLPVFCANIPPLHETGQNEAHYFSPQADPAEVARLIATAFAEDAPGRLRRRVRREFTWQQIFDDRINPLLV
jgi:glycosyltransferase involved in cell wall biosynthesis